MKTEIYKFRTIKNVKGAFLYLYNNFPEFRGWKMFFIRLSVKFTSTCKFLGIVFSTIFMCISPDSDFFNRIILDKNKTRFCCELIFILRNYGCFMLAMMVVAAVSNVIYEVIGCFRAISAVFVVL